MSKNKWVYLHTTVLFKYPKNVQFWEASALFVSKEGAVNKWHHPLRQGEGICQKWLYSISLIFSKMWYEEEGGVKNIKLWVKTFTDSPLKNQLLWKKIHEIKNQDTTTYLGWFFLHYFNIFGPPLWHKLQIIYPDFGSTYGFRARQVFPEFFLRLNRKKILSIMYVHLRCFYNFK